MAVRLITAIRWKDSKVNKVLLVLSGCVLFCCSYTVFMVFVSVHGMGLWKNRTPRQKYKELNKNLYFNYVRMHLVFDVKSKAGVPP